MSCCEWVLTVAAAAASTKNTPSWLHRLHAKGGLSFPSDLRIDDLLYAQPQPPLPLPPPPSSSSDHHHASPQDPPPKPKQQHPPPNPSGDNPPLFGVLSDLFAIPSAPRSTRLLKAFRKHSRPRPRPDKSPPAHKDSVEKAKAKAKAKARKRRRAERSADADGERCTRTEVTVIDTSTDGWKAAKLLLRRGTVWKIRDKKDLGISEPEDLNKGKRRAGLVSKIKRDKKKEDKDATSPGNIRASSGDGMKESDDTIQTLKRPRCSESAPEVQSAIIPHLESTSTFSQP